MIPFWGKVSYFRRILVNFHSHLTFAIELEIVTTGRFSVFRGFSSSFLIHSSKHFCLHLFFLLRQIRKEGEMMILCAWLTHTSRRFFKFLDGKNISYSSPKIFISFIHTPNIISTIVEYKRNIFSLFPSLWCDAKRWKLLAEKRRERACTGEMEVLTRKRKLFPSQRFAAHKIFFPSFNRMGKTSLEPMWPAISPLCGSQNSTETVFSTKNLNSKNVFKLDWTYFHRFFFSISLQMYAITWQTNLISRIGDMDVFILIISCICHDLDHPGYNNIYQINAKTELALR